MWTESSRSHWPWKCRFLKQRHPLPRHCRLPVMDCGAVPLPTMRVDIPPSGPHSGNALICDLGRRAKFGNPQPALALAGMDEGEGPHCRVLLTVAGPSRLPTTDAQSSSGPAGSPALGMLSLPPTQGCSLMSGLGQGRKGGRRLLSGAQSRDHSKDHAVQSCEEEGEALAVCRPQAQLTHLRRGPSGARLRL